MVGEQTDLSIITGLEGYRDKYSVSEITVYLESDLLSQKSGDRGAWVFWRPERYELSEYELLSNHTLNSTSYRIEIEHELMSVLKYIETERWVTECLVQFWTVKVDDGGHRYLTTSDQPFCFGKLCRGLCWYRKQCMDHIHYVEEGANEEQLGAVGRVYRKKHPESSPDLRLYSTHEFPLRDYAARFGLRSYLALPVFYLHSINECYGVLEVLSFDTGFIGGAFLELLNQGLQEAGLRSTHTNSISPSMEPMPPKYKQQGGSEITKMLELAIKAVPQLHLAQVWVPCKQCAEMSNHLSCMERLTFINQYEIYECDVNYYIQACKFHNIQTERGIVRALVSSNTKSYFCRNLCDISISENPLVHYAQKARFSNYFAICLESVHASNDIYIIEFFLQSTRIEDACGDFSLQLLSRIMDIELKSYNFALQGQLGAGLVTALSQPNAIQYEPIEYAEEMEEYRERYSESDFQEYLQTADLCCQRPSTRESCAWVFCSPAREELLENDFNINSYLVTNSIEGKIKAFMKKTESRFSNCYSLVQFWAPKMEEDKCYLATSDQPYALGCLYKGLAFFRKQCMKHRYLVDEGAKEEELGPPGRVFRNGHPEYTPDIRLYSTREFSLRNHAAHCCLRAYNALPVFDSHGHKCVGVLECVGFRYFELEIIENALKAADLNSNHINFYPKSFRASHLPANIIKCRKLALTEIDEAIQLVSKIPQLCETELWVPYYGCASTNSNLSCMERPCSKSSIWTFDNSPCEIHVSTRKGIAGMVLASEDKSCLFQNLSDFSITHQSLAHFGQRKRMDVCFAIGLQSLLTGNLLYVLQFFLNQGPTKYEYLRSFLKFLLPIMKQELQSFKVASGKRLGEELVVEVIEFSESNKLTFPELDQIDIFPVKFKTVQYGQKEHQHSSDQQMQYVSDGINSIGSGAQAKECCAGADNSKKADAAKKTEKGKEKTGARLINLEALRPYFGKRLKDVTEELGVGRSTIKRVLREHNISRWPNKKKYKKNPSLFIKEIASEIAPDSRQNMQPSTSGYHPTSDMPLHQNVPQTNTESTQHLSVQAEAEKVIVKVECGDGIIKLGFYLSSGIDKLLEEVALKLNLEKGSFKLKYVDEDNDDILLVCDADLQDCPKSLTAGRKTCIRLFVHPK